MSRTSEALRHTWLRWIDPFGLDLYALLPETIGGCYVGWGKSGSAVIAFVDSIPGWR